MSKQILITNDSSYIIQNVDAKTGKVSDQVTLNASKCLEPKAMGQIIGQTIKTAGSRRDAWLSFLSVVFSSPRLDGFKGQGDKKSGKVSKEFKAAVRDAEGDTIRAMVGDGSIKLGKGEAEAKLQEFLSEVRADKNYSNVKVTASRYFAMVGANVVTKSGYLVPVEVMQAQIAEVVDKDPEDKSISAKLRAIEELMSKDTIDSTDAIDSLAAVKRMLSTLEGVVSKYAELATNGRVQPAPQNQPAKVGDVVALSDDAIKAAQASTGFGAKLQAAREAASA